MNDSPKREIDSFDRAILRMLQTDNKMPQRLIAEAVGLSAPAVQRRIVQLESSGVIEANTVVIDPESVGQGITAIIEARLRDDRSVVMDRSKRYFAAVPEIQQCYFVNGGVSFIIVLLAKSLSHFESLIRQHFADYEDVKTYRTLIVLDRVKVGLGLAI